MRAVYAIIPAAGLGTRMQGAAGAAPKQFLLLGGNPILIQTLLAFAATPALHSIWIAVRAGERERLTAMLASYAALLPAELPIHIVEGGDSRQESVARALAAIPCEPDDVVLVHDAVRPLVEPGAIVRTIAAIEKYGAAIVALPATDTIKQVERTADGALITATIPRENIVQAQTPQGARAALLRRAMLEAEADGFMGTDEASLLERAGIAVAVVPGAASNLKITQAGDLPLAEWYLAERKRKGENR
ncbi:2-C-methyl-D-erythritol 4-phosphate cytidylyltransferase [Acidipila sp. EB88]|uniref:2-C-methyl-D-erythritol 4-phosphate cytidylyltransferase n=1 Tax=Acidipila sp. EB88 TaxID=2305226 RepID=UPI000F5E5855|nr:2-C-methyl-D-erythritol 4-phosphate cytidylyltransferase [Acidipila sp. EB88]RRA48759.1 2-C-methyl-D-erythritol 4-phosphate cytidylyltransferase [Acidipila sp. EB88]